MSVRIQNVVAKLDLRQPLELEKFVRLPDIDVQYKPAVFPGVIIKDGEGPTFLLFKSGRGVCVGARAVDKCVEAARKLFDKLVKHGVVDDSGVVVEIQNIVASAELGFPWSLKKPRKNSTA
jgi:transcription initiation factor TFIID TATA-box-binding protein